VAVGVATVPTKPVGGTRNVKRRIFKARKLITVSGGTLGTPQILQRSGIGDPAKLKKLGIKPVVGLPGVGLNFQDHYLQFATYRATPDTESFDDFVRGDPVVQKAVFEEWNLKDTGPLATNGIESGVKSRPTTEELEEMKSWPTPEFVTKGGWDSYFQDKPDKPVMHYSVIALWCGDHLDMPAGKFFTMFHFLEYPFSRGWIHVNSADPYDSPDFDAGFMNDKRDMAPMVWGYIQSCETARRMRAYAREVTAMHPHYGFDSPARCKDMGIASRNAYGGPNHITANIAHGTWTSPFEPGQAPKDGCVNSNAQHFFEPLKYRKEVSSLHHTRI
jgi:alcohol oxidase